MENNNSQDTTDFRSLIQILIECGQCHSLYDSDFVFSEMGGDKGKETLQYICGKCAYEMGGRGLEKNS